MEKHSGYSWNSRREFHAKKVPDPAKIRNGDFLREEVSYFMPFS